MNISKSSLLQSFNSRGKNKINSYNLPVIKRIKVRLESHLNTTDANAKQGQPKTYNPVQQAPNHFSRVIAGTQQNKGNSDASSVKNPATQTAGSTQQNDMNTDNMDSVALKSKIDSKPLPEAGKKLDLDEIEQANFKGFKKSYGAKEGETNYNTRYDYDNNGVIDMVDWLNFGKEMQESFQQFKAAYGSHSELGNYISKYDYDGNGVIDMVDWLQFGKNWTA